MASRKCGYLVLCVGGTGVEAGGEIRRNFARLGKPFPLALLGIDSDPPAGKETAFDLFAPIHLKAEEIQALLDNIDLFGPEARLVARKFEPFLHRESVGAGSKARRPITQLALGYHKRRVAISIRKQIKQLMTRDLVEYVQPIIVGSTGGGCGSALCVLLAQMLADELTRQKILAGFADHVLYRPIVFAIDPYAKADLNNEIQEKLLYSNAASFRMEVGELQSRNQLAECYLSGMSNANGVVIGAVEQLYRQLGNNVFWHMRHASNIESIKTNFGFTHYSGSDTPEAHQCRMALDEGDPRTCFR